MICHGKQEEKEAADSSSSRSSLRVNFESISYAVILALFCRAFVAEAYKIPTSSMEPTLLIGDHLVVNKMIFSPAMSVETKITPLKSVQRGDIVVFKSMADPAQNIIKRVVGLPTETVRIEGRQVYIDGKPLDEPYAFYSSLDGEGASQAVSRASRDNMPELTIPEGHYFVMGDNRDNSYDSRFWGTLPETMIRGRALLVYWSYEASSDEYLETNLWERVKDIGSVAIHFFTRTRWERFFQLAR